MQSSYFGSSSRIVSVAPGISAGGLDSGKPCLLVGSRVAGCTALVARLAGKTGPGTPNRGILFFFLYFPDFPGETSNLKILVLLEA